MRWKGNELLVVHKDLVWQVLIESLKGALRELKIKSERVKWDSALDVMLEGWCQKEQA